MNWRLASEELHPARLLLTSLVLCVAAAVVKFFIAFQTLSLAVQADAAFALLAVTANLSGLLSFGLDADALDGQPDLAARRRQMHAMVLVAICVLLGTTTVIIFSSILERLQHPVPHRVIELGPYLIGLAATGAAHYVWFALISVATRSQSLILSREAGVMQSFTVLAAISGLIAWSYGHGVVDAVIAIGILGVVLRAIYHVVYASVRDRSLPAIEPIETPLDAFLRPLDDLPDSSGEQPAPRSQ